MQETITIQPDESTSGEQHKTELPTQILPWAIWLIATGFVLFQFQLQLCSGPMVNNLMQSFSITAFGAGILSSTYYYVYALMQIPAGMLIDRYGAHLLLTIGGAVCTVGCALFAYSSQLLFAEFGRVLMGGGSAFAFIGALYLIGRWFPASSFAMMMGMSDMIGSFGSLFGNIALAASIAAYSWRGSMKVAALIALVLTVLNLLVIRDSPKGEPVERKSVSFELFKQQVKGLLCNYELWLHGIYVGILFAVVAVFSGMWGIPLLSLQEHISNTAATSLMAVTFAGLGVSCPIMGWLFPRITRPRWVLIWAALIAAATSSIAIYFPPDNLIVYGVLMFILGSAASVYVFNFGLVQEITSPEVRTTANGFVNMLCVGTIPILQPLIGYLLHYTSSHAMANGQEVYTLANYQVALSVIPITLVLAALVAFLMPKHPQHIEG